MEQRLSIQKTVRYFTYGNPEKADNIWIVLHGYSQLPAFFIQKFKTLDPEKNFIIAPEGIHRFYRKGTNGKVGASWMTKEARLDDIEDNIQYLNNLSYELLKDHSYKHRFLLGFSQGGATAARWHNKGNFHAHHFILWGSVFPEDISLEDSKSGMEKSNNYFVVGKSDPFLAEKISEIENYFQQQPFTTEILKFDGGHAIYPAILWEIEEKCSQQ